MKLAWPLAIVAPVLCIAPLVPPAASAQRVTLVGAPPIAFKFSEIRSRERADTLVALGSLVKVHLLPTDLGGDDDPSKSAYVTPEASEQQAVIAGKIRRLLLSHSIDQIDVVPEYREHSIVPFRVRFKAWHSRGGKPFEEVVQVWH